MQRLIVPSSQGLGIQFNKFKDLTELYRRIERMFNLESIRELGQRVPQFPHHLLVAKNGRTYFLNDVLSMNPKDTDLEFLSKQADPVMVKTVQDAEKNNTLKELMLTPNGKLATLIVDLSQNGNNSLITSDLPSCGIDRLPLIFPSISVYGHTFETIAIERHLRTAQVCPVLQMNPLSREQIIVDLSLQELMMVVFAARLQFAMKKAKSNSINDEALQEIIQSVDEYRDAFSKKLNLQMAELEKQLITINDNKRILMLHPRLATQRIAELTAKKTRLEDAKGKIIDTVAKGFLSGRMSLLIFVMGALSTVLLALYLTRNVKAPKKTIDEVDAWQLYMISAVTGGFSALLIIYFPAIIVYGFYQHSKVSNNLSLIEKVLTAKTSSESLASTSAQIESIEAYQQKLQSSKPKAERPSLLRGLSLLKDAKPTDRLLPPSSEQSAQFSYGAV